MSTSTTESHATVQLGLLLFRAARAVREDRSILARHDLKSDLVLNVHRINELAKESGFSRSVYELDEVRLGKRASDLCLIVNHPIENDFVELWYWRLAGKPDLTDAKVDRALSYLDLWQQLCKSKTGRSTLPQNELEKDIYQQEIITILRRGSGLTGVVWKGRQESLDRFVAIKVIKADMERLDNALQHARTLARFQHPNVVTVHFVTRIQNPEGKGEVDAVVMEWLAGPNLFERLRGDFFELSEAIDICDATVRGIRHMHSKGLSHDDLHLENVMITDEAVKIIDLMHSESRSFAMLQSDSIKARVQVDADSLRFIFRRVLYHTECTTSAIDDLVENLSKPMTIDDLEQFVRDLRQASIASPMQRSTNGNASTPNNLSSYFDSNGLEPSDATVMQYIGAKVLNGRHSLEPVGVPTMITELAEKGLTSESVLDAVEILGNQGFFRDWKGRHSRFVQLSSYGFDIYLQFEFKQYKAAFQSVKSSIVNDGLKHDFEISAQLELPRPVALHFLEQLADQGLCAFSRTNEGFTVVSISAELKREFKV